MDLQSEYHGKEEAIFDLFEATFSDSEGAEEGALIGTLARDLLLGTDPDDLFVFSTWRGERVIGCIIFSRLTFSQDPRTVFVLSPVAIATSEQSRGIGQKLLTFGLDQLRTHGIDIAITYGSPDYYARVGFEQIREADAQPPFTLEQPHGWLAQSLTEQPFAPLKGPCRCVNALNDAAYW